MNENNLPTDIGGYQHVVTGPVLPGDIWVSQGKPVKFVSAESFASAEAANGYGKDFDFRLYRQMMVPRNHCADDNLWPAAKDIAAGRHLGLQPQSITSSIIEAVSTKGSKPLNPKDIIGSDKIPMHLWPTTATALGALAMLDGALKYGRSNFRDIGVRSSIYYDAARRHLDAWFEGEDVDPDSGLSHLAHLLACAAILIDADVAGRLTDDRMYPAHYRNFIKEMTPHVKRLKDKYMDKNPKHYTIKDKGAK